MTVHMSARLAWHMDGWNGHVCKNPSANTYCVGPFSYPGEMIAEKRDLKFELACAGSCCSKLKDTIPPCIYSINAFRKKQITAFADPPVFFKDSTSRKLWDLPPATVCLWPYEWMYGDDVKEAGGGYDYHLRLQNARDYFAKFDENKSLIFYYSNYSNPLNLADERRYAVVGMSRIKKVADIRFFEDCSDRVRDRYAGGFIWQCDVTSHYPDQGFRLPYHLYLEKPDVLNQFAFFPENPWLFKYGTPAPQVASAVELSSTSGRQCHAGMVRREPERTPDREEEARRELLYQCTALFRASQRIIPAIADTGEPGPGQYPLARIAHRASAETALAAGEP